MPNAPTRWPNSTARGLEPRTAFHEWVGWHSIYVKDPDGNTVELVSAPEPA